MRTTSSPIHRIDVTTASLVRIGVFVFSVWLITQLWDIVLLVAIALIFAGTLSPYVAGLERRLSRSWAVAGVVLSLLVAAGLVALITVPPLVSQVAELMRTAPEMLGRLADHLHRIPALAKVADKMRQIDVPSVVTTYGPRALTLSTAAATLVGYAGSAIVLAVYFLADPLHAKTVLFAMVPRGYHVRTARILVNLETIVGGYMRGQAITSACMALFTWALLSICGVPNPLPLAVFAGLADVIPMVGAILAITPAVLSALPQGIGTAVAVAAAMIVYQEFENRVLAPRVYGRTLRLSPSAVLIALLVGGKLMGILGALLALPLVAALLMIIEELRVELPGEPAAPPVRKKEKDAEALYAARAEGATAEEAAVIAHSIATDVTPRATPIKGR